MQPELGQEPTSMRQRLAQGLLVVTAMLMLVGPAGAEDGNPSRRRIDPCTGTAAFSAQIAVISRVISTGPTTGGNDPARRAGDGQSAALPPTASQSPVAIAGVPFS